MKRAINLPRREGVERLDVIRVARVRRYYDGARRFLRFPRSQRVKERETPENVESRPVTGTGFVGILCNTTKCIATLD